MVSDNLSRWRDTKGIRYIDASWNKQKKSIAGSKHISKKSL